MMNCLRKPQLSQNITLILLLSGFTSIRFFPDLHYVALQNKEYFKCNILYLSVSRRNSILDDEEHELKHTHTRIQMIYHYYKRTGTGDIRQTYPCRTMSVSEV